MKIPYLKFGYAIILANDDYIRTRMSIATALSTEGLSLMLFFKKFTIFDAVIMDSIFAATIDAMRWAISRNKAPLKIPNLLNQLSVGKPCLRSQIVPRTIFLNLNYFLNISGLTEA